MCKVAPNVSRSEKRDHFALKVDFELEALSHSIVDGLSVALSCASIAAPITEIRSLAQTYESMLGSITRKRPVILPLPYL